MIMDGGGDHLAMVGWISSGGGEPRFMTLSPPGTSLAVASQMDDKIIVFEIEAATGGLTPKKVAATASPTAIVFL
jgi:6-phosphogluconolactonase (cycloisomerase 2 family)